MHLCQLNAGGFQLIGHSLAGEETFVAVPELDVVFDIGRCPREALSVNHCALSHGHMDHANGIAYYASQRNFVGQVEPTLLCHHRLVQPLHDLLDVWARIEGHRAPCRIVPLEPGAEHPIRKDLVLRAFAVNHHAHALGYCLIERRRKLKPEFLAEDGQPRLTGPQLVELKQQGVEITTELEIPLVAYCGDTAMGSFAQLDFVRQARVLLVECTFFEPDHIRRARQGRHLHVVDMPALLEPVTSEAVVLLHLTRRTAMGYARKMLRQYCGHLENYARICFLMDRRHRMNPGPEDVDPALALAATTHPPSDQQPA